MAGLPSWEGVRERIELGECERRDESARLVRGMQDAPPSEVRSEAEHVERTELGTDDPDDTETRGSDVGRRHVDGVRGDGRGGKAFRDRLDPGEDVRSGKR